ncbi:TPA: threonine synthase [Aeromonas hydrophila subsp. hydrophila]|nr:threonine synthase [Aeromonas hydrophila subsp. hydrophila]
MDESLSLDVPLPGPLAKLPLLSHNLPAEFAWLRGFLVA